MKLPKKSVLLRVFIGENDRFNDRPLYEEIVIKARELNMAGATVLRGIMGFGADTRISSTGLHARSKDLPLIIEIVDSSEKINKILPFIDEVVLNGMVTVEKVKVLKYQHK